MMQIGVLSGGVVTPDGHLPDIVDGGAGLLCQLRFSAVMVEARHRGKLTRVDVRCIALRDQRIGIGGVPNDQNLDAAAGNAIDRLALNAEDGGVGLQKILTLHAGPARPGAHQQRIVAVFESHVRVICAHHARQKGKGTVVQLHFHAV